MFFGLEILSLLEKNDILNIVKDIGVAYPVSFCRIGKLSGGEQYEWRRGKKHIKGICTSVME